MKKDHEVYFFSKKAMTEDKAYPQLLKTKTLNDNTVSVGFLDG